MNARSGNARGFFCARSERLNIHNAIADTEDRFALRRLPNGAYCVDGRVIPVAADAPDTGSSLIGLVEDRDAWKCRRWVNGCSAPVPIELRHEPIQIRIEITHG